MRIDPSPLPPGPAAGAASTPDPLAETPFASLLESGGDTGEPPARALNFLELGMFGARAVVSPAALAVADSPAAAPSVSCASGHREAGAGAAASAARQDDADSETAVAQPVTAATEPFRPAAPWPLEGVAADAASAPQAAAADVLVAADPVAESRSAASPPSSHGAAATASGPGGAPSRGGAAGEAAEGTPTGSAPSSVKARPEPAARAPLALRMWQQDGAVKLAVAVAVASLPLADRARLRGICARLLADHGLTLDDMRINGGAEGAPAFKGDGHGPRAD